MNVEDLLEKKNIPYTQKGQDYLIKCLNPEHDDSNPSLRVDKITGIFGCFSCEYKGNIFSYFGQKPNAMQMKREFLKRKIQTVRADSIGLSMPSKAVPFEGDWRNIKPETYQKFQAFLYENPLDPNARDFSGRLNFPISNLSGNIVAFVGRHMTTGIPKYLNSPAGAKMPLFPKVQPIQNSVILVEGIYDMLNLHDKGLDNAICCFGVKNVTEEKLSILSMQGVDHINIFLDNDEAGQKAADRIADICEEVGLTSRNIKYGSKDADAGSLSEKQVQVLKRKLYEE